MDYTDVAKMTEEFHERLKIDAEHLIVQKFPERILLLNEILNTPDFGIREIGLKYAIDFTSFKIESSVINNYEVTNPEEGPRQNSNASDSPEQALIPSNKKLIEIMNVLKPHIMLLVEDTNILKLWVSLLIPKIEDGNDIGVSVQGYTLSDLQHAQLGATNFYEAVSHYYESRGKLISKILKFPFIEDYQRAIEELDQKQYISMSLTMLDIRNQYAVLHDTFIKNIEKIKKPRTSNIDNMY